MTEQPRATGQPAESEHAGQPGRQLALVGCAQVLALGTWFAASAVAPALRQEWQLSGAEVPLLTIAVQVGFVIGALISAALNLADRLPAPRLMAASATGAAFTTAGLALVGHGLGTAVPLRFFTGVFLAGVYPVGLKLVSSWFLAGRGLALGVLVGALTLGSILPNAIGGAFGQTWRPVLAISATLALVAALLAGRSRIGPYVAPATRLQPRVVLTFLADRGPRLANLGYFGHMWELYATWTWAPTILATSAAAAGSPLPELTRGIVVFATFGVGGAVGCLVAGRFGDRFGREKAAAVAMLGSGTCCLLVAVLFGRSTVVLIIVLAVWGITVIADSAMFSACVSSVVDPRYVGTALTFQTAVGFLITVITIQGLPVVAGLAGWRVAVSLLAIGPLLGAIAMLRLTPLLPQPVRRRRPA